MQPWVNVGRTFYISKSKWADSNLFAKHHQALFTSFECFSMECPTVIGHMTAEQEGGICWCWHDSMMMAEMVNHPQAWKVAIHRQYAAYFANTNNLHHHLCSTSSVNCQRPLMRICVIHRWRCHFYGTGCCCDAHPAWLALHHRLKAKTAQWPAFHEIRPR